MKIRNVYHFKIDDIVGLKIDSKPEKGEITRTDKLLFPEENCLLHRKGTEDYYRSIILDENNKKSDFEDIENKKEED